MKIQENWLDFCRFNPATKAYETMIVMDGITYMAKIDTGAITSNIDTHTARIHKMQKTGKKKRIRLTNDKYEKREMTSAFLSVFGKYRDIDFTISDRQDMKYRINLGIKALLDTE